MPIDYSGLPEHLQQGMRRYLEEGIPTGAFLAAVLQNDLIHAILRADDICRHQMVVIIHWLINHAPTGSYGSQANVARWLAAAELRPIASDEEDGA